MKSVSHNKWASSVVPVVKVNGQIRLYGDYKFTMYSHRWLFSKIDLTQAYNQMEVEESSRELLTIYTHKRPYQYTRLQFGVAAAVTIWQRAMDHVLQGTKFTSCGLDDMIISGKTDKEHLANLNTVLEHLEMFGLRANMDKCEFFKEQVSYCGQIISEKGLKKSPDKVKALRNALRPEFISKLDHV